MIHPYIATVFEIGEEHGITFIAMELIRGRELTDVLEEGSLSIQKAVEFAVEIAEGLACAHVKGIVHRDLKPGNVMITDEGHVKIIDFGLAKLTLPLFPFGESDETAERATSQHGAIKGTFAYMSPEQSRAEPLDPRSDIFSFVGVRPVMRAWVLPDMSDGSRRLRDPASLRTLRDAGPSLNLPGDGDIIAAEHGCRS